MMEQLQEIRISNLIAKVYQPINLNYIHRLLYGGRATTKTSCNALTIIMELLNDPKAECIVARQDAAHHRDSTMKELIIAAERLGLENGIDFEYGVSPMHFTLLATKQVIKFGAMNDVEKLKGFKPSNSKKYFSIIWFFEISEFKSDADMNQVVSTFIRGNKPNFNVLYETNPPAFKHHWFYSWLDKYKQRPDFSYQFTTYLDLTKWERENWLGKFILNEIENLRIIDEEQYNHIYLGMTRKLLGTIYKKFDLDKHVKEIKDYSLLTDVTGGVDFGESDATAATLTGFEGAKHLYVLDQYYHRNSKDEKDINDYAKEVDKFYCEWSDFLIEKGIKKRIRVYVDSANKSFKKLLDAKAKKHKKYIVETVDKRKSNDIEKGKKLDKKYDFTTKDQTAIQERIDFTNLLIGNNRLSISSRCKQLIIEMESAIYNEKGVRKDDSTNRVDSLDSFEYSFKAKLPKIRKWILSQNVKESD